MTLFYLLAVCVILCGACIFLILEVVKANNRVEYLEVRLKNEQFLSEKFRHTSHILADELAKKKKPAQKPKVIMTKYANQKIFHLFQGK
jgi:hypothetical protein